MPARNIVNLPAGGNKKAPDKKPVLYRYVAYFEGGDKAYSGVETSEKKALEAATQASADLVSDYGLGNDDVIVYVFPQAGTVHRVKIRDVTLSKE